MQIGEEPSDIEDDFLDAHLIRVEAVPKELVDIVQFLQGDQAPKGLTKKKKKILAIKVTPYTLINGSLYKLGQDDVLIRCVPKYERKEILEEAHLGVSRGHY